MLSTTAVPSPAVCTGLHIEKSPDSNPSLNKPPWLELACTTAVAAEVAVAEPAELLAVTATRKVTPASPPATR